MGLTQDHPAVVVVGGIAAAVAVLGAAGGAGWAIATASNNAEVNALKTRIETLELTGKDALPSLLTSVREASDALKKDVVNLQKLAAAEAENERLRAEVAAVEPLRRDLAIAQETLANLGLQAGELLLKQNEVKKLGGYDVTIALSYVGYSDVNLRINNELETLDIGESMKVAVGDRTYTLVLEAFDEKLKTARLTYYVRGPATAATRPASQPSP